MKNVLGLFEGFGIELEYMITNNDTLKVLPVSDLILKEVTGGYNSDFDNEEISWSNELVLHVIELKTNGPADKLEGLEDKFHENVLIINDIIKKYDAVLLPSGANPFFIPAGETKLWPHENNPVYDAYNRIFGCEGHGWSNLQSTHINLPFGNEEEFRKLHAAIRFLLPVIPGLTASTPVIEKQLTGFTDTRLNYYKNNQKKVPIIAGDVIPEILLSYKEYQEKVFDRIFNDIAPYDTDDILKHEWLNSRGAIARFERNAIEIRVIDLQESPLADISLAALIIETLHYLCSNQNILDNIIHYPQDKLVALFNEAIKNGENTVLNDAEYCKIFGINEATNLKKLWTGILAKVSFDNHIMSKKHIETAEAIINNGTLANRIIKQLNGDLSEKNILATYKKLQDALTNNLIFIPDSL